MLAHPASKTGWLLSHKCPFLRSFCFASAPVSVIFYFFRVHDFDKNDRLDGLELLTAFTDHNEGGAGGNNRATALPSDDHNEADHDSLLPEEVEVIVDRILQDHDADGDGFLTYTEVLTQDTGILNTFTEGDDEEDDDQLKDTHKPRRPDGSKEPDPSEEIR